MPQRGLRALFPVFGALEQHHRTFHAVLNFLRMPARAALAVVAYQDRLSQRDSRCQRINMRKRLLRFNRPPVTVVTEPPGALLLAIKQGAVLVLDITGEGKQDILPPRRPGWRHKEFLFGRPAKACFVDQGIRFFIEP